MAYTIVGWSDRYELRPKDGASTGPLRFYRARVFGHSLSSSYRRLLAHEDGALAFGLFHKLLEMAADNPRRIRDGTILNERGNPATLDDIQFATLYQRSDIEACMRLLCSETISWVSDDGAFSACAETKAACAETKAARAEIIPPHTETETETQTETQTYIAQQHRIASEHVEAIYQAYPRHVGKQSALTAIKTALATINKRESISNAAEWLLQRVRKYAAARADQDKAFTPHPATWFRRGSYDDEDAEWTVAPYDHRDPYQRRERERAGEYPEPQDVHPRSL